MFENRHAVRVLALIALFVSFFAAEARADWFVNPWVAFKFGGSMTGVDLEQSAEVTKVLWGGSAGFLGSGILGIEADFAYGPRFFERTNDLVLQSSLITLMGNIIIAVPLRVTRDSLRPYVVGGVGLLRPRIQDILGVFDPNSNLLGLNVGGGAIGPVGNRTSIRFELRRFSNLTEGEPGQGFGPTRLSFWRADVGVTIRY
jgi:hypothetical protein